MGNFKKTEFITERLVGYVGKNNKITARSGWETTVIIQLQRLARVKKIASWNSEEVVFEYHKSIENRTARYFMDMCVVHNNGDILLIEVKPFSQTIKPFFKKGMNDKQKIAYQNAMNTFITNSDKWNTVMEWCENMNRKGTKKYTFQIWTEKPTKPAEINFFKKNAKFVNFPVKPVIPV